MDLLEDCKYNSLLLGNFINNLIDLAETEKINFDLNKTYFDLESTVDSAF